MFLRPDPDGRIEEVLDVHQKFANLYPEHIWVDASAVDFDQHYVEDGQVKVRPEPESFPALSAMSIPADGTAVTTLTNIPAGAKVQILGPIEDEWIEDSGSAELSVDIPGRYVIKVEKWPQKSVEVSFHAT